MNEISNGAGCGLRNYTFSSTNKLRIKFPRRTSANSECSETLADDLLHSLLVSATKTTMAHMNAIRIVAGRRQKILLNRGFKSVQVPTPQLEAILLLQLRS